MAENLILQRVGEEAIYPEGQAGWRAIRREAKMLVETFDVRTPSVDTPAGKLSGGNAQKMILARELARQPRFCWRPNRHADWTSAPSSLSTAH